MERFDLMEFLVEDEEHTIELPDAPYTDVYLKGPYPKIAIVGSYSAGKSSLVNHLFQQHLLPTNTSRTTSIPTYLVSGSDLVFLILSTGELKEIQSELWNKVRDELTHNPDIDYRRYIDFISIFTSGHPFPKATLIDTPGYTGSDEDLEITKRIMDESHGVIFMLDASRGALTEEDMDIIKYAHEKEKPFIIIANKIDKVWEDRYDVVKEIAEQLKEDDDIDVDYRKQVIFYSTDEELAPYLKMEKRLIDKFIEQIVEENTPHLYDYYHAALSEAFEKNGEAYTPPLIFALSLLDSERFHEAIKEWQEDLDRMFLVAEHAALGQDMAIWMWRYFTGKADELQEEDKEKALKSLYYAKKAIDALHRISEGNKDVAEVVVDTYMKLGNFLIFKFHPERAKEGRSYYEEAIPLAKWLMEQDERYREKYNTVCAFAGKTLSDCYSFEEKNLEDEIEKVWDWNRKGVGESNRGNYKKALQYYRKAMEILERLYEEYGPFVEILEGLGSVYGNMGYLLRILDRPDESLRHYEEAIKYYGMAHAIVPEIDSFAYWYAHRLYDKAALLIDKFENKQGEAEKAMDEAIFAMKEVVFKDGHMTNKLDYLYVLGEFYRYMGIVKIKREEFEEAVEYLNKAIWVKDYILQNIDNLEGNLTGWYIYLMGMWHYNRGYAYYHLGKSKEACSDFKFAKEMWEWACKEFNYSDACEWIKNAEAYIKEVC